MSGSFWANARQEMIIQLRGWFFRLFAIALFVGLMLNNIIVYSSFVPSPWALKGIQSFLPYGNSYLFNILSSALLVFLLTDLIKRDMRINSMEVIYVRSMSNFNYLVGKVFGLLLLFFLLNLLILGAGALFQILFGATHFRLYPYLIYPLIFTIPSLIFIAGVTLLMMRIVRNQAVAIILVLGYLALMLFYGAGKVYGIFDALLIQLPLVASDFINIPGLNTFLTQRIAYMLAGLAFIMISSLYFHRLPQEKLSRSLMLLISILILIFSGISFYKYYDHFDAGQKLRAEIKRQTEYYKDYESVSPISYDMNVEQHEGTIRVKAKIVFVNSTTGPIEKYIFSLNPGLHVNEIQGYDSFFRKAHVIEINARSPLDIGGKDSLTFIYSGDIDQSACYIDVSDEDLNAKYQIWVSQIGKDYAFITSNYMLLTPESMWYPIAGIPASMLFPVQKNQSFFDLVLKVLPEKGLKVISQGLPEISAEDSSYTFRPEVKIPSFTLIAGDYLKETLTVDSIEYNLYRNSEHDFYESYFSDITDTLKSVIGEIRNDYERGLGLQYPYKRLNLIEVPVQYYAYPRIWTKATQYVLPEQVLLPEMGFSIEGADFKSMQERQSRRRNWTNMSFSKKEEEIMMIRRFIQSTLMGENDMRFISELSDINADFNIFPLYFTYVIDFHSDRVPVFKLALEAYMNEKSEDEGPGFFRRDEDLTPAEKASLLLSQKSLSTLLSDSVKDENIADVINYKGTFLFKLISSEFEKNEFESFINDHVRQHLFTVVETDSFLKGIDQRFNINFDDYIDQWYNEISVPGYLISDLQMFKIFDEGRLRYQVLFNISNPEPVTGIGELRFRTADRRRFMTGGGSPEEEPADRILKLDPGVTKEIGVVLDSEPRMMTFNPIVAHNIPLEFTKRFEDPELNQKYKSFDGERILKDNSTAKVELELIVDNEDPGFSVENMEYGSVIKRLVQGEIVSDKDEYTRFSFWRPPGQWSLIKNENFYGKYIHSAFYIKSGNGNRYAKWEVDIDKPGQYEVFTFVQPQIRFFRHSRLPEFMGELHYLIKHHDGTEEVELDLDSAEENWNSLGTYYFSKGKASVVLSDKSDKRLVIADAVKWKLQ